MNPNIYEKIGKKIDAGVNKTLLIKKIDWISILYFNFLLITSKARFDEPIEKNNFDRNILELNYLDKLYNSAKKLDFNRLLKKEIKAYMPNEYFGEFNSIIKKWRGF